MPANRSKKSKKSGKSKKPVVKPESESEEEEVAMKVESQPVADSDNSDYSGLEDSDEEEPEMTPEQKEATEKALAKMTKLVRNKNKSKKEAKEADAPTGVVYLGHVPFGFFEAQMEDFFSQFGLVLRLKLARNRKTGRSKHYAFIEFDDQEIARIVADAMNGYMMFGRTLQATVVPPHKVHPMMFRGAGHITPHRQRHEARKAHNKTERSDQQQKRRVKRLLQKERKRRSALAAMGVEYTFPGYDGSLTGKKRKRKATPEPEPEPEPEKKVKRKSKRAGSRKTTSAADAPAAAETKKKKSTKKRKSTKSGSKGAKASRKRQ